MTTDIVIIFSKKEDASKCAGYLYRHGESYETGTFRKRHYIVITEASGEITDEFSGDDVFVEYERQVKIGMFHTGKETIAYKFLSNCETVDLPMVEDIYREHLGRKKKQNDTEHTDSPDVYLFGHLSKPAADEMEKLEPGLAKEAERNLNSPDAQITVNDRIHCTVTGFHPGWNPKYICILSDNRVTGQELVELMTKLGYFCRNQNYKHESVIRVYSDTMKMSEEDLDIAEEALSALNTALVVA